MPTRERFHIVHVGRTGQYEKTDPDYVDKRMAQLQKDYSDCPEEWRHVFLAGIPAADLKAFIESGRRFHD